MDFSKKLPIHDKIEIVIENSCFLSAWKEEKASRRRCVILGEFSMKNGRPSSLFFFFATPHLTPTGTLESPYRGRKFTGLTEKSPSL